MSRKNTYIRIFDSKIKMIRIKIWKIVLLLLISSVLFVPIKTHAEEVYLISRIIEAKYPPNIYVHKDRGYTGFLFVLEHQTENPSSTPITIPYICTPYLFPYLRTNLLNKNLTVNHIFFFQWPISELTIPPNYILNRTESIYLHIDDYYNKSLPLGIYEMWFDFTNCSNSPVPVVVEKLYIDVTETSITYYFDYNNTNHIVSSLEETAYTTTIFISLSILVILRYVSRKLKR